MKRVHYIYIANLFLGFHYALISYINSSFLSKFISNKDIGLLYILGAILNITLLFNLPKFLNKLETKTLTGIIILLEFITVYMLSRADSAITAGFFFVAQQAIGVLIVYCFDLFLEFLEKDESNTGRSRSYFTTALNLPVILSFITISYLANNYSFSPIYVLSAFMLVPVLYILSLNFNERIHKSKYADIKGILMFFRKDLDTLRILSANLVLQTFYAVMTIYLPLLLFQRIGFDWEEIGLILMIAMIPFILFEIPAGQLIDRKMGESELLAIGFIIMGASSLTLPFLHEKIFILWALILFMSRIGASLVEVSSESYFFKKVTDRNPGIISLFRITQSLSNIIAPIIGIVALQFTDYAGLFGILGVISLLGLATVPKIDSR